MTDPSQDPVPPSGEGAAATPGSGPGPDDPGALVRRLASLEASIEALEEERRHLRAVLAVLPVGVWIADADGKIVARNDAAAEIWDREARLSESIKDYEEDYRGWRIDGTRLTSEEWGMTRALHHGVTCRAEELEIETASGQRKRILNYAAPIRNEQGEVTGGVAVNVDITARRAAEARGVRQDQVLDAVGQGVIVTDPDGRVTFWNPASEALFGWRRSEAEGRSILDLTVPEEGREVAREILDEVAAGHPWSGEFEVVRKDGSSFPGRVSLSPIHDPGGGLAGLVGLTTDLTPEKAARERREELIRALEHERSRLEEIFEGAPAFMAVLRGPDHVFELANPLYRSMVGERELLGRPLRAAIPEMVEQGFVEVLDRVRETGEPYVGREEPILLSNAREDDPRPVVANFVYQPIRDVGGDVSRIVVHGVAVTDLVEARQRAEAANRAKSDFLAAMSHELRTPLNAIVGYTDLVEAGVPVEAPPETLRFMRRIRLSARHLQQIIEEILQVGRLEAGREGVSARPVDLGELLEEVRVVMEPLAEEKGLALEVVEEPLPGTVVSDARKLRQILVNLVGNALKFTERGRVEVRMGPDGPEGERLRISVADTGPGISAAERERLFEPFWQADRELRRTEGAGLGLTIIRRLAGLLGGTVDVESEVGRGSVFTVVLPRVLSDP